MKEIAQEPSAESQSFKDNDYRELFPYAVMLMYLKMRPQDLNSRTRGVVYWCCVTAGDDRVGYEATRPWVGYNIIFRGKIT